MSSGPKRREAVPGFPPRSARRLRAFGKGKAGKYVRDFDVVAIGGGTAGMTVARLAKAAGATVCLVDRQRLGGDCLYTGCVPTKTLVASAKLFHDIKRASSFGIDITEAKLDYSAVRRRVRAVMCEIGETESPAVFEQLGIRVKFGEASFLGPHQLRIGNETVTADKFVIATGSRAVVPSIPGLRDSQPLTNVSLLDLEELPDSIAIIGSGPIGTEFSQILCRFGTRVTVIDQAEHILPREDPEIAGELMKVLAGEGVQHLCGARISAVRRE
ncbi:MAG: FAD-dependent oxidoreductase, partial [Chloroflexota bacterium]|nr:FAD-dependent oxidoreductase [Chloroflexota bacterium]